MNDWPNFTDVPSSALTARLYEIRRQERQLLVEFLQTLAEIDARSVYLELGFSSLFAFLTDHLGFSRSSAFRRSTAARLLARFPAAAPYLADGRLGLTTFVALRDALDEPGATAVLDRASGKTEEQIKELIAALAPQPAPPDLLRRLPAPAPTPPTPGPALLPAPPPRSAPRIEPISEELHVLRMTVGKQFVADLEATRAALSHQIPGGSLEAILHECLRRVLREHARRRAAETSRSREPRETAATDTRTIAAAVRRAVWKRDQGCCSFVGEDGRLCRSTHQLELHHVVPFALGGTATVENIRLFCRRHNPFVAERELGREHLARARVQRRGGDDSDARQLLLV